MPQIRFALAPCCHSLRSVPKSSVRSLAIYDVGDPTVAPSLMHTFILNFYADAPLLESTHLGGTQLRMI